jgi:predicted permease
MFQALAPIFFLIMLGYFLGRMEFPAKGFWPLAESLTYYVLFPALLVDKLAAADLAGVPAWHMAAAMAGAVTAVSLVMCLARPLAFPDRPAFTSVFQGAIRPNTYVGLSTAWALLGGRGLVLSAVAIMTLIPLVNLFSVTCLAVHGDSANSGVAGGDGRRDPARSGPARLVLEIGRNPLILACAAGILLNLSGQPLPETILEMVRLTGRASLTLGLLAVGAGLRFAAVLEQWPAIAVSGLASLVFLPLAAWFLATRLGLSGAPLAVSVIFTAIPTSVSSFILARQMGGDHRLMAAIITAQTAAAVLTLPLALALLT